MRILALRPRGSVIPSIHDSMVKAFTSSGVETSEIPSAKFSKDLNLQRELFKFHAVFPVDMRADETFVKNINTYQQTFKIQWIICLGDDLQDTVSRSVIPANGRFHFAGINKRLSATTWEFPSPPEPSIFVGVSVGA